MQNCPLLKPNSRKRVPLLRGCWEPSACRFFNPGLFVKKVNEIDTNQVATCVAKSQKEFTTPHRQIPVRGLLT